MHGVILLGLIIVVQVKLCHGFVSTHCKTDQVCIKQMGHWRLPNAEQHDHDDPKNLETHEGSLWT